MVINIIVNKNPPPQVILCQMVGPNGRLLPLFRFNDWDEFRQFVDACIHILENNRARIPEAILKAFNENIGGVS